jgi:hypothetical protein
MLFNRATLLASSVGTIVSAILFATSGSLTAACGECRCARSGASLSIPEERAAHLDGVAATGDTCAAVVNCTRIPSSTGPGFSTDCNIDSSREGTCHVEATFTDGTPAFVRDVTFRYIGGCCAGIQPDTPRIEIPAGSDDAGADATADDASVE